MTSTSHRLHPLSMFPLLIFLLLLPLLLLPGCSNRSGIKTVEMVEYKGNVVIEQTPEPGQAMLHVLIQREPNDQSPGDVLAEETLSIKKTEKMKSYRLTVPEPALLPGDRYSMQACMTSAGRLTMVSSLEPTTIGGKSITGPTLYLLNQNLKPDISSFHLWQQEEQTALKNSVQSNLIGTCKTYSPEYDRLFSVKASEILPKEYLSGKHHKINEQVSLRGPYYSFSIESDFGQFTAQGLTKLKETLREIEALEKMQEFENTENFKDAFTETTLAPFGEFKEFILNPIDRLQGVAQGIGLSIKTSSASLTQKRSEYEDRYLEALLSVSKYKRRYAAQLLIDVYTGNAEVQKQLNRIGWAAALGNWGPSVLLFPYTGPAKLTYSTFSWSETLNRIITEESPDILRLRNRELLKGIGISDDLNKQFLSHKNYSPRHHTVISYLLESLKEVEGKNAFLTAALAADNDNDTLAFQRFAELLAGYHQQVESITIINIHKGVPFALTEDKDLVMLLPIDLGRWTPFSDYFFSDFGADTANGNVKEKKLWLSGPATESFKNNMSRLNISLTENAEQFLPLSD